MQPKRSRPEDVLSPIRATIIFYVSLISAAFVMALVLSSPWRDEPPVVQVVYGILILVLLAAWALCRRSPELAGALCTLGPLALVSVLAWLRGGISNPAGITAHAVIVVLAGLGWSWRGSFLVATLSSGFVGWLIAVGPNPAPYHHGQLWAEITAQLFAIAVIVLLTTRALFRSTRAVAIRDARFREVIEGSPEAIVSLDPDGIVDLFNPTAAALEVVLQLAPRPRQRERGRGPPRTGDRQSRNQRA